MPINYDSKKELEEMMAKLQALNNKNSGLSYSKLFDGAASFESNAIMCIDVNAMSVEERAKSVPLLIEFLAVRAEKRRRKVRFLLAQVMRRIFTDVTINPFHLPA